MVACRLWEKAFTEDKLWDTFYKVGRAKGVTKLNENKMTFNRLNAKVILLHCNQYFLSKTSSCVRYRKVVKHGKL